MSQTNKKVLISGGSRGIGKALVKAFANNGFNVAFIYNRSEEAAKKVADDTGAFAIRADISQPDQAKHAVFLAAEQMGGIDILINNAGISQIKLMSDITDSDFSDMISTNLGGAFTLCREVSPFMIEKKNGRIINIGSMWGKCGASCEVH